MCFERKATLKQCSVTLKCNCSHFATRWCYIMEHSPSVIQAGRDSALDIYLISEAVYEVLFQSKQKPESSCCC